MRFVGGIEIVPTEIAIIDRATILAVNPAGTLVATEAPEPVEEGTRYTLACPTFLRDALGVGRARGAFRKETFLKRSTGSIRALSTPAFTLCTFRARTACSTLWLTETLLPGCSSIEDTLVVPAFLCAALEIRRARCALGEEASA